MKKKLTAKLKQKIRLDVGCGFSKQPGFVGMDKRKVSGVDVVHDAEKFPWPFDPESCALIMASHLIEHIKPWLQIDFFDECWRILEPGGLLAIATPYATSFGFYQDPTHCSPWNEATVQYFCAGTLLYEVYRPKPWQIESQTDGRLHFFWNPKTSLEVVFKKITEAQGEGMRKNAKKS